MHRGNKKLQYISTFFVEFSVVASGFVQYRLATNLAHEGDFELFAFLKRILGFSLPLFILGLGVALPRYLAISPTRIISNTYFTAGLLILLSSFVGGFLIMEVFKDPLCLLLFDNLKYAIWITPLFLLTFGYICHSITYNYFRGHHWWLESNIIQFLNLGIIPLVFFLVTDDLYVIITGMSYFYFTFFLGFIIFLLFKKIIVNIKNIESKYLLDLLKFGFQRLFGDILLGAFFLLPALVVTHSNGILEGGKVAFALTFINMAGAALGPISIILLPDVANHIKNKEFNTISALHKKVTFYSLIFGIIALLVFLLTADFLIPLVFDNENLEIIKFSKILFFAVIGYTFYILLRSFNDALNSKAYNSINILVGFIVFMAISQQKFFMNGENETIKIIIAFVLGHTLLGLLTYLTSKRLIKNLKI